MFQMGITRQKQIEPTRIDGGPRESEYDPRPRPVVASVEQLARLKGAAPAISSPSPKPQARVKSANGAIGILAADKQRIVERYCQGEDVVKIAADNNTSAQRVREILKQAGAVRHTEPKPDPEPVLEIQVNPQRSDEIMKTDVIVDPPSGSDDQAEVLLVHERYMAGDSLEYQYANCFFNRTPEEMVERFKALGLTYPRPQTEETHRGRVVAAKVMREYGFTDDEIAHELARVAPVNDTDQTAPAEATPEEPEPAQPVVKAFPQKRTDITDDTVRRWTIGHKLYGETLSVLAEDSQCSIGLVAGRIKTYLKKHPNVIQEELDKQAHARGRVGSGKRGPGQMDDPEIPPAPATPPRTIIRVEELAVTTKPYTPPAIIGDGLLLDLVRPGIVRPTNVTAVGQMVQALVEELNAIPGVTAFFDFDYRLTAGVRP